MTGQDYMSLSRTGPPGARPGPEPAMPGGLAECRIRIFRR
jgi:hypothetical protein